MKVEKEHCVDYITQPLLWLMDIRVIAMHTSKYRFREPNDAYVLEFSEYVDRTY